MMKKNFKETLIVRMFGWTKIPLLGFCMPEVLEVSETRCEVKIPLSFRTKNHLGSMYFGALSIGADCAGGLIAMRAIQKSKRKIRLIFKDFQAEFLKRPEGDVHFVCTEGALIRELVERAHHSGLRENLPVHITAYCPKKLGSKPVAHFTLTLSLKSKPGHG